MSLVINEWNRILLHAMVQIRDEFGRWVYPFKERDVNEMKTNELLKDNFLVHLSMFFFYLFFKLPNTIRVCHGTSPAQSKCTTAQLVCNQALPSHFEATHYTIGVHENTIVNKFKKHFLPMVQCQSKWIRAKRTKAMQANTQHRQVVVESVLSNESFFVQKKEK